MNDLEFFTTDELLEELKKRFDAVIFIAKKKMTDASNQIACSAKFNNVSFQELMEILRRTIREHMP